MKKNSSMYTSKEVFNLGKTKEGLAIRLEVGQKGFTLWIENRWIIDCSTFVEKNKIYLSRERLRNRKTFRWEHKELYFKPDSVDLKEMKK